MDENLLISYYKGAKKFQADYDPIDNGWQGKWYQYWQGQMDLVELVLLSKYTPAEIERMLNDE